MKNRSLKSLSQAQKLTAQRISAGLVVILMAAVTGWAIFFPSFTKSAFRAIAAEASSEEREREREERSKTGAAFVHEKENEEEGENEETEIPRSTAPAVSTEKGDYNPGDTAQIHGINFHANETVTLRVVHTDETAEGGSGHEPWTVTTDALGNFSAEWFVNPDDSEGSRLKVSADCADGLHAEMDFTDSVPPALPNVTSGYQVRVVAQGGLLAGKHLSGMVTDPITGNIYVTLDSSVIPPPPSSPFASGNSFTLLRIAPNGSISTVGTYNIQWNAKVNLAWGPDGKIYTLNSSNQVITINPATGTTAVYGNAPFSSNSFYGMAFDPQGNLIVSQEAVMQFYKINAGGAPTFLGGYSSDSTFNHGDSFGIQPDGNYVVFSDTFGGPGQEAREFKVLTANHVAGTNYSFSYISGTDKRTLGDSYVYSHGTIDPLTGDVYTSGANDGGGSSVILRTPGNGTLASSTTLFVSNIGNGLTASPQWPASSARGVTDLDFGRATSGAGQSLFFLDDFNDIVYEVVFNQSPSAVNDSATVSEDSGANPIDVRANDSDPDAGDVISVTSVTQGAHGVLAIGSGGANVIYTPAVNYSGTDSFTYTITDSKGATATATVSITITAVNDPPVATGESYSTNEDTQLNVAAPGVLSNDSDIDSPSLTAALVNTTAHGVLTLNLNGSFSYMPAQNFNGADSFTYQAVDDQGITSSVVTVNISVGPVNDAPVAGNDSYSVIGDLTLNVAAPGVLSNDTDIDSPSLTAAVATGPAHGTLSLKPNGSFTYTPNTGYTGTDSFTYHANDGSANSNDATVTITIAAPSCVSPNLDSGWQTRGSLSVARRGLAAAEVNGTLYAVGGVAGGCGAFTTLEAYDPGTDSWIARAPLPQARYNLSAAGLGGLLYVVGGNTCGAESALVQAYDPATNSWTTKAPLPAARENVRVAAVNGKLYALGGMLPAGQPHKDVWEYDPATNTWTAKAPMPFERMSSGIGVINGMIYVAGGQDITDVTASLVVYNPGNNTWTAKAPMPTARTTMGAAALDGKLYTLGGNVPGGYTAIVEAYDPATDSWSSQPSMLTPRTELAAATTGGKLYAIGGFNLTGNLNSVESFTPNSSLIAWYPLNGNADDLIGGNNGTAQDGASFTAGQVGQALSGDGINAHAVAPDSATLHLTSAITIEAWINPGSLSQDQGAGIVAHGSFREGAYAIDIINPGSLRFFFYKDDATVYQVLKVGWLTPAKLNTWSHIAASYDAATGTLNLYDDGNLIASSSAPIGTQIGVMNHELSIGSRQNNGAGGGTGVYDLSFTGLIDEVRLYNRALTASEIQSLYNASSAGLCPLPATTTTVQNVSRAYSPANQSLTLSATVAPASGSVNDGQVTFTVKTGGGVIIGSPVVAGVIGGAASTTFTLPGGTPVQTLSILARYVSSVPNFQSSSGAANVTILKATPNVSWANPADLTYDAALSTTQLNATADVPGTFTYTPNSGTVLNAGNGQTLSVTFAPADATNYESVGKSVTINVIKATSTTTVTVTDAIYDGAAHGGSANVTGAGGLNQSLPVSYAGRNGTIYGPSPVPPTNAGDYTASASFAGDSNHEGSNDSKDFMIGKASTTTTVVCPNSEVYTGAAIEPCSASFTGAGGLSGSLTPVYANNVNAGTASASATYAGDANHSGSTDSKTFEITRAASTTEVTCPANVTYSGSAIEPCTATVSGAGGLSQPVAVTYSSNLNAGTAQAGATFAGDANHTGSSGSGNFTIDKAASITTVSCPATETYTGGAIEPCTGSVSGAGGLSQTLPVSYTDNVNAGTAHASAAYTGDTNHLGSGEAKTFEIARAATLTTVTCSPSSLTYTGSPLTPCTAGVTGAGGLNQSLTVTYTGNTDAGSATAGASYDGDSNHLGSSGTGSFTITKASSTTVLTFEAGPYVYRGSAFTATAEASGAGSLTPAVSVAVVYSGDCTNVSSANGCTATATYAGDANHESSTDTKSITITRANAHISVNGYTGVYDAQSHGATGSAAGVNNDDLISLLNLGSTFTNVPGGTAHWTFAGNTNYEPSSGDVAITISKAEQTITWTDPAGIVYGTVLTGTQLNATIAGVAGGTPTGVLTYSPAAGTLLHAGPHQALAVNAAATGNYNASAKTVYLDVARATPVITWATPAAITYGTPLSATQLNATAAHPADGGPLNGTNVAGSFVYTPAASTVLPVGNNTLSVSFTPANAADYTNATQTVTQRVGYGVCALYDQTKASKSGSTIPIKLQLCNASGGNLSSTSLVVHAIGTRLISPTAWGEVSDAGNANPDMDFRLTSFDGSPGYIFNLKTTGLPTGTYQLGFMVGTDPAVYTVQFQIR